MGGTNLLNALIIKKYGKEKFKTGCELVAQWISVTAGINYSAAEIHKKASAKSTPQFTRPVKEALRKLFSVPYDP